MPWKTLVGTLVLSIGVTGCNNRQEASHEIIQKNTTNTCMEILQGENIESFHFWKRVVEYEFPIDDRRSFMRLYSEIQSYESDDTFGSMARKISEKYLNDPPEDIADKNRWSLQQMHANLAEILYTISKFNTAVGKYILGKLKLNCSKRST